MQIKTDKERIEALENTVAQLVKERNEEKAYQASRARLALEQIEKIDQQYGLS